VILNLQKKLQNLEDASDELMMCDDAGNVPYPFLLFVYVILL